MCSTLTISGHLVGSIVNGAGDALGKVQFSEIRKPRDLDLGWSHTTYHHPSVINLYLRTKFHCNRK